MKRLILMLVIAPFFVLGDLVGQELQDFEYARYKRQAHPQYQQQQINYRPVSQAPGRIQQLLASQQARDPIVHLPPQPPPRLGSPQRSEPVVVNRNQASAYNPHVQQGAPPQQPTYRQIPVQPAQPQYRQPQQAAHQQQANYRAVYRPVQQPQANPQPQYSTRLPAELQQLLRVQQQLPNAIPQGAGQQSKLQRAY